MSDTEEKGGRPILLFLFQNWEAKSDCKTKDYPTKMFHIFGASIIALKCSKMCLLQMCILGKIYCRAQLRWEKHRNFHCQDMPCPFHRALQQVPKSSHRASHEPGAETPKGKGEWRERVVVMGVLEKKGGYGDKWCVFSISLK